MTADWKTAEELAARLEAALAPDAIVETNVYLPVIGQNRSRQCDVVIRVGAPPRQTISIVEVQKRRRRPDITTFHGWHRKMQEIGAQHLICVSERGYPQSIVEEVAQRIGPTVRLLTLEDFEPNKLRRELPLLVLRARTKQIQVQPTAVHRFSVNAPQAFIDTTEQRPTSIGVRERVLATQGDDNRVSITDLVLRYVDERYFTENATFEVDLAKEFSGLLLHSGVNVFPVKECRLEVWVNIRTTDIPFDLRAYRQEFTAGALAWIVTAQATTSSGPIALEAIFTPDSDSSLRFADVRQIGGNTCDVEISTAEGLQVVIRYPAFQE